MVRLLILLLFINSCTYLNNYIKATNIKKIEKSTHTTPYKEEEEPKKQTVPQPPKG